MPTARISASAAARSTGARPAQARQPPFPARIPNSLGWTVRPAAVAASRAADGPGADGATRTDNLLAALPRPRASHCPGCCARSGFAAPAAPCPAGSPGTSARWTTYAPGTRKRCGRSRASAPTNAPLDRRRARRTRPAQRQTRRRRGEHERAGRHRTRLVRRQRRPQRRPRRGHRRCGRPLLLQRLQEDYPPRRPRRGGSTRAKAEALGIRLATPKESAARAAEHLDQTATKECSPARPDGPGPAGTPACCRQRRGTRGQSSFLAFSLGRNLWRAQRHSSAVPPASSGTGSRASGASTYPSAVAVHTVRGTNAAAPSIPHRSAG